MKTRRWRSSTVEQLICNQQAAGSIPIASSAVTEGARRRLSPDGACRGRRNPLFRSVCLGSIDNFTERSAQRPDASPSGGVPERSKGTDCKSVATGFEGSNPSPSTGSQIAVKKRNPCRAGVAQLAEL